MANSVVITTAIPTWEETVARYRLSKADRRFVENLFEEKPIKSSRVGIGRSTSSGIFETKRGVKRKTSRARKIA